MSKGGKLDKSKLVAGEVVIMPYLEAANSRLSAGRTTPGRRSGLLVRQYML